MEKIVVMNKLQEICREVFSDINLCINEKTSAVDIEKWDSMTNLIFIDAIEKTFEMKISLDEIIQSENIGDFCNIILKKSDK